MTLDKHCVKFERMADWRKQHCSYASHVTPKRDELKSLLDRGVSVDGVQKGIAQVIAAECNAKFIQLSEGDDMLEEVPQAQMLWL